MKNIAQRVILKIIAGQSSVTEQIKLRPGFVIRAGAIVAPPPGNEGNLLTLGLRDDQSIDIVEPINVDYWRPREGGSYFESMMPLNFESYNRQYNLTLSTNVPVSYDTYVEVVFFYENTK